MIEANAGHGPLSVAGRLYLDLLKGSLTRTTVGGERRRPYRPARPSLALIWPHIERVLAARGLEVVEQDRSTTPGGLTPAELRRIGADWPVEAETMIGLTGLDNLEECVLGALEDGVPGDLLEAGVWRGGATIFMRGILAAWGDTARRVVVADSFAGLPKPDPIRYPADADDEHWTKSELVVGVDEVKANFARYGLLDDRVEFLVGFFSDTLPTAPVDSLAVLRVDGDMYQSVSETLRYLYPKVSPGGYVIIDDYGAVPGCAKAVDDYRQAHGIEEEMLEVDWTRRYWRKVR